MLLLKYAVFSCEKMRFIKDQEAEGLLSMTGKVQIL